MDNETTTDVPQPEGGQTIQGIPVDDQGQAIPQPEPTEETTAAEPETTEQPAEQPKPEETPAEPSDDEQLSKWAANKGLELDSDNARKAAKMAWNAEKQMHQATSAKSELEKTMETMSDDSAEVTAANTGQDPEVLKRLQRMEVKESIRDFWAANPEARQYEQEMAKIATEAGLYGSAEAILKASYAIAVANNQSAVKSQGKREALETLAQKQQAAVPRGNAVTSGSSPTKITPQNVDVMVASMSAEEYRRRLPEINAAMAG